MENPQTRALVASLPLGPRKRLEALCLTDEYDAEVNLLDEILKLARTNPEVFLYDIVDEASMDQCGVPDRRSPLSHLIRMGILTAETFETIYSVSAPRVLESYDSWGDTVLYDFLCSFGIYRCEETWFDLLKAMLKKSKTQLTLSQDENGKSPIMLAVHYGCTQEMVQYMINKYPGDPFREESEYRETLLGELVRAAWEDNFSFDFIKYVVEQYPEAASIQETDEYQSSVFHSACSPCQYDVMRLLLYANPMGASIVARYGRTPLHNLLDNNVDICDQSWWNSQHKKMVELVSVANPKAIFSNMHHHKEMNNNERSPFSALSNMLLRHLEGKNTLDSFLRPLEVHEREIIWSYLYFLMSVYRYGNNIKVEKAWNPPSHPVHMAASCPCPSNFLLYMAKSNPEQLLIYDNEGRSVLALALESGHSMVGRRREGVIQELVQIDYRIIGLPDSKTGLYPFMTAACCEEKIAEMGILDDHRANKKDYIGREQILKIQQRAPMMCLDTVYFLLRSDPSKVLCGFSTGS